MKKLLLLLSACAALMHLPEARAEVGTRYVPCGYQQFASGSLATAQSLTIPGTCSQTNGGLPSTIVISVEGQAIRYRDDGTAPTATVGMPLPVGNQPFYYTGTIGAIQFIQQTAGAIVNVAFYR